MIDLIKCLAFMKLQVEINNDIDMRGETSPWKAAELDVLVDSMNEFEREWILLKVDQCGGLD